MLAGMVSVALVAIYPHGDLVRRVTHAPSGPLTTAYLTNLLRTDPGNPSLRLMLARRQAENGEYAQVRQTMAPALASPDPELRAEAVQLLWETDLRRMRKLPPGAEREALQTDLRRRLAEMAAAEARPRELGRLAQAAFSIGDNALGVSIFDRLAQGDPQQGNTWYREAARESLGQGDYGTAARFFLLAAGRATSLAEERTSFLEALRALTAGERVAEAAAMADRYLSESARLREDMQTLVAVVQTARAARRPDIADKYARKLLRLSLLEQWQRSERLLAAYGASARKVALKDETPQGGPAVPFDDRIYTLGFEAFLDNRKLEDAWKVAASAVRQAPDNLAWRERLAKVSEWTGRPRLALEHWLHLARRTGSEEAWQAVLRIAPGLFDHAALKLALQHRLDQRPGDETLIREMAALYERQGDPAGALAFLEKRHAALGRPWLLQAMAEIAERQGEEARALAYWRRHLQQVPITVPVAMRVATLMLLNEHSEEALALLQRAVPAAQPGDNAFWRFLAEVARREGKAEQALAAYRKLIADPDAAENDYNAAYVLLLTEYPREAGRVAETAWRRFGTPVQAVRALIAYSSASAFPDMGRLLGRMDAHQMAHLRGQPEFLRLVARYRVSQGDLAAARRDLEQALALAPGDLDTQQALLWVYMDDGDGTAVRQALTRWEAAWRTDVRLHDTLAAAYLTLSLPEVALKRYLTPQLKARREDFLWLMNYADALEQNGEADRAWRLRQHLLAGQGRKGPLRTTVSSAEIEELRRVARTRLIIGQRPGDPAYAALRELLRLDRDDDGKLSTNAAIVATAWLQNAGEHAAERAWLWERFARNAARPLWAEISLALAEGDREAAGRLLERHGEALPRHDRVNAARLVGDLRRAQSLAFETHSDQPADEELHLQLTEALLAHSDHAGLLVERRALGGLDEAERGVRWHLAMTPTLTLDLAVGQTSRSLENLALIGTAPDERYRTARLEWRQRDATTGLEIGARDSFAAYRPLLLEHRHTLNEQTFLTVALGRELPATDSVALRLAGLRDRESLAFSHRLTGRDTLSLEIARERYRTQTGTDLGSGRHLAAEWRHAIRVEARDLEAGVFWSDHRYQRRDGVAAEGLESLFPAAFDPTAQPVANLFLPESYRYYGVRLSTDARFERDLTRAWRPYAAVARTWNSLLGPGYDLAFGLAGSVLGADHLRVGWTLGKGGREAGGGLTRQFGITYRLHY